MVRLAPMVSLPTWSQWRSSRSRSWNRLSDPLAIGLEPLALLGEHQPPAHPVKQGTPCGSPVPGWRR